MCVHFFHFLCICQWYVCTFLFNFCAGVVPWPCVLIMFDNEITFLNKPYYTLHCTFVIASNQALPLARKFQFACKKGESLVYFDHVLDVVGRGFQLAVGFAHAHARTYASPV